MKYIQVKNKRGELITIMEDEFNAELFSHIKQEKAAPVTKEEKAAPKRRTKAITSENFNNANAD
jgi:hypothetical protein